MWGLGGLRDVVGCSSCVELEYTLLLARKGRSWVDMGRNNEMK